MDLCNPPCSDPPLVLPLSRLVFRQMLNARPHHVIYSQSHRDASHNLDITVSACVVYCCDFLSTRRVISAPALISPF